MSVCASSKVLFRLLSWLWKVVSVCEFLISCIYCVHLGTENVLSVEDPHNKCQVLNCHEFPKPNKRILFRCESWARWRDTAFHLRSFYKSFLSNGSKVLCCEFLVELTKLFQKARIAGSVTMTMKRYDGRTKPHPRDDTPAVKNPEYKCLIRAQSKSKKISTVVEQRDVEKFTTSYSNLLKTSVNGLKRLKKPKKKMATQ